ncbi:caprin homolog isoform X2 [Leptopilina boulardi]|uniref:caprin homolog isoform X2 n=1 Tax=Leptopilina boulardi TaxID=63433 RepID=UPI0021F56C36|nr:caprin homolog isoform X2 [Leptopilina boulardi]
MPSANPKLEKQASTEAVDPIRQAVIVIEHKIRNLEKRKGKLESYKDLQKGGGELNADQKTAVAKYDEVIQTLDITRDLHKSVQGIANDAVKQQKKLARKEALERIQQDIAKVREVLLIQDTLMNMGTNSVREDFLAGKNGAIKLADEDLTALDSLFNEVTINHKRDSNNSATIVQQSQKVAEHLVAIVEGKQRDFEKVGVSYFKLKEIITSITQCGYFDQIQENETTDVKANEEMEEQADEEPIQEQTNEEFNTNDRHIPPADSAMTIPNLVQMTPHPVVSVAAPVSGQIPVLGQQLPPQANATIDSSYYTNAGNFVPTPQAQQQQQQPPQSQAPRINDVIGTPNFFFLQESELDSPDVTPQPPMTTPIIPTVNAPIPTQTFTNQNFSSTPVVQQPVLYQHQAPPSDMSHIPGFANPNPPPPIPMPPSHQQPNIQYSPQHPTGYQQPQGLSQINQSQSQVYDQHQQDSQDQAPEKDQSELNQQNEAVDWGQMSEGAGDWCQTDQSQDSSQDQQQSSQQNWGDQQRSRGRGGRRGNTNGYGGRNRGGSGGYQQNGRSSTGSGQGSYYRNENSSYQQNGYGQRNSNWSEGSGGYNSGFKRGSGGTRGGRGGQFRGNQRGTSNRGSYSNRSK